MTTWDVQIGGVSVDALQEVTAGSEDDGTLGTARVIAANTQANRNIDYSQEAEVFRNGVSEYLGFVTKKPSLGSTSERLEFTIADQRVELRYIEAHRPFYQMDPGAILREGITETATVKSPVSIHRGSSTSDWSSDTPEFGLVSASAQQLQDEGSDVLGMGFPEGSTGTYEAIYSGVPSDAIPGDGQIIRLTTRMLANSFGDQFSVEVELNDNAGNTYVWPLERVDSNFKTYSFAAEDAQPSSTLDGASVHGVDGTLVYRVNLKGSLSENRAIALDYANTLPFDLNSRSTEVGVGAVEDVGTVITRRFDENLMEMLASLGEEFGHTSWVDDTDTLHFEPAGASNAPLNISYQNTPVFEVNVDRDSDQIVNRVTVQGGEGAGGEKILVTASDSASIEFYGLAPREQQVVDKNLQTQADARRKAEGFLAEHAWDDVALSFRIADRNYADTRVGQAITVTWPPEDITAETYTVSSVEQHDDGSVTVGMTGSGA